MTSMAASHLPAADREYFPNRGRHATGRGYAHVDVDVPEAEVTAEADPPAADEADHPRW
jgi:hypothetical protein